MSHANRSASRLSPPVCEALTGGDVSERLRERDRGGATYSIRDVEAAVATRYSLPKDKIKGLDRTRAVARPRQIAMYLARETTGQSLPRIGAHFCRDHTTVLHAVRRINRLMAEDAGLAAQVEGCRELIARSGPWRAQIAQREGAP